MTAGREASTRPTIADLLHGTGGEPLDRFLTRCLPVDGAAARRAIQQSRVTVNGVGCKHYHRRLVPTDQIAVAGVVVPDRAECSVLLMHKPGGVACSHLPDDAPLVYGLIPDAVAHPGLHTCGRLDRDTTGLLVLTWDGALTQRLTEPRRHVAKRYRIAFAGDLAADAVALVAGGLVIADEDTPCLPTSLTIDAPGQATLILHEGRHHQVKRMITALGGRVVRLHRDRIGGLDLPGDLAIGLLRAATVEELTALLAGGR